jgi:serine/threonine protein kinase
VAVDVLWCVFACLLRHVCLARRLFRVQNLLLSAQFLLKICDFGFAAKNVAGSPLKTECGTKSYMAPEVVAGRGYDGAKADIFSCGVILFIILTGFPPFQAPLSTDWWFHKLMTKQHDLFWQVCDALRHTFVSSFFFSFSSS